MALAFADNSWLPEEDFQVVRSCILSSNPWVLLDPMWNSYGLKAGAVLVWGISSLTVLFQLVAGDDAVTSPKAVAPNTGMGITGDTKPTVLAGGCVCCLKR